MIKNLGRLISKMCKSPKRHKSHINFTNLRYLVELIPPENGLPGRRLAACVMQVARSYLKRVLERLQQPPSGALLYEEDTQETESQSSEETESQSSEETEMQNLEDDGAVKVYSTIVVNDADATRPPSRLSELPAELVLQIMRLLSSESLYSFRQSSPRFMRLFDSRRTFKKYHGTPQLIDRHLPFRIETMTDMERNAAAGLLQRDERIATRCLQRDKEEQEQEEQEQEAPLSYCTSCTEVLQRGERDPVKMRLRETRFCDGCQQRHMCVFFTPASIDQHDRGTLAELHCVGRTGSAALCSHELATPLTWKMLEGVVPGSPLELNCEHVSQIPSLGGEKGGWLKAYCPSLSAKMSRVPGLYLVVLSWERPLLKIDPGNIPSLRDTRKAVANSLRDVLPQTKLCRHMADGRKLCTFAHVGICKCFCDPSIEQRKPRHKFWSGSNSSVKAKKHACSCSRKEYLECRECAATYTWLLERGRITLAYRYHWVFDQPTSPAWLNLLPPPRQEPNESGILNEENRHLLWCDELGCDTGMGRRWEEMVKEAIWLQDNIYHDSSKGLLILQIQQQRSVSRQKGNDDCLEGFKLPPLLLEDPPEEEAEVLIKQIKEAEDSAREIG